MVLAVVALRGSACCAAAFEPASFTYEYVSPVPGSQLVSPANNVVLRTGRRFLPQQIPMLAIEVTGSESGRHAGRLSLSDDDRTLVFEPGQPFSPGERVVVEAGKRQGFGFGLLPPLEFDFVVSPSAPSAFDDLAIQQSASDIPGFAEALRAAASRSAVDQVFEPVTPSTVVPVGYPRLQLIRSAQPEPGMVFLSPFSNSASLQPGNLTIVDDELNPMFFRLLPAPSTDFKLQPNGRLTYFAEVSAISAVPRFVELDSAYTAVDSFAAGNGYLTDSHDLQLLPNGHALLMSYDPEPVRMDLVVDGGRADAIVTGLVVQELDQAKRVVFQWRSWDHFAITDAASPLANLTSRTIDWVHGNAIEPDLDGNLLLSSRHLSEITKIDRRTGAVLWRMGPHAKQNQFRFDGDARGFSHQHDIRRIANGDLTLFDNGNNVAPERSRAVEYRVDETNHVATEVWEYRRVPEAYGSFMGSVQRLADGATMIGWGGVQSGAGLTELHGDASPGFEVGMGSRNVWTYRAFRFPWQTTRFRVEPAVVDFGTIPVNATAIRPVTISNPGPAPITIHSFEFSGSSGFFALDNPPVTLAVGESASVRLAFHTFAAGTTTARLTFAEVTSTERIALPISLTGTAVHAAASLAGERSTAPAAARRTVGEAVASFPLAARVANPARGAAAVTFTVPREERATLEVFGVDGRRIATLVDRVEAAGEHVARWNAAGVPGGIYFCRLSAGGESVIARVALID